MFTCTRQMALIAAIGMVFGCSNSLPADLAKGDTFEGDESGECSDEADNDRDGAFDCEDDGCDL